MPTQISQDAHQVEAIFHAALSRRTPEERTAYLDGACGDDARLHSKIEALLKAHDEAGHFLVDVTAEQPVERLGASIDRYRILQLIGEGGFGTVYMAEQQQPVRRMVALKIIKLGMDTKQVIARFEAERQALALMDHPNIARVLDAGATDSGRPYFVMELVRGVSITEYCDRTNLDIKARLALFLQVCQALQHAHQKGIIHRDIKPSNVMVTMHDGQPVPKIIDFGVSKATNQRLTEKTLFTEYHQFIGTPQYMSPEQAEMSGLDIDTRSDLYSLGSLLYELLTGSPPFDKNRFREIGYVELQRIICDEDPPKPSTRAATLIQQDTSIAQCRGVPPQAFSRVLRGELDCIVMKAMAKDRTRRYDSASALAADITRYLSDQPVIAAPPGMVYNITKFVRRHRLGVFASCLVAASLIIGCALAVVGFVQARRDRDIAEREIERTRKIADYLHNVLVVSDPNQKFALTQDLDQVVNDAHQVFGDDPATVAAVLNSISIQLQEAGDYGAAEDLLNESVAIWQRTQGPQDSNVSVALTRLGRLLMLKGDEDAAERAFRQAISICEKQNDQTAPYLAAALSGLAEVLQSRSDYEDAELALQRSIAIRRKVAPQQKIELALTINRLANVLSLSGKAKELEPALDECLAAFRDAMPANHAVIAKVLTQISAYYIDQKQFAKADGYLREALAIFQHDPTSSQFYRDVALRYLSIVINHLDDDSTDYVAKRREYLNLARNAIGDHHPQLGLLLSDYAKYMVDHDVPLEAIELSTSALRALDTTVGLERYVKGALVALETAVKRIALDPRRATDDYQQAMRGLEVLMERDPRATRLAVSQAALQYRLGRPVDALALLADWQPETDGSTVETTMSLGFMAMAHQQLGHWDKAASYAQQMREQMKELDVSDAEAAAGLWSEVEETLARTASTERPVPKEHQSAPDPE